MAAQDAQLLLKVGLDLSTFRNQLATLGQAAAGYNLPIKLQFGRKALQEEVRYLKDWLGKKKFNIELNIVGGLTKDQFEKIQGRFDALSKTKAIEIPVGVRAAAGQKDIQKVVAELNRSIKGSKVLSNTKGKLRAPVSIRAAITQDDIAGFKREVDNKLSGIKVKVGVEVQGGAAAKVDALEQIFGRGKTGEAFGVQRAQSNVARQAILSRLEEKSLSKGGYNVAGIKEIISSLGGVVPEKASRQELVAEAKRLVQASDNLADSVFERLKDLRMQLRQPRVGAFPYVAKTGAIEPKALFAEAQSKAARIDAENALRFRAEQQRSQSLSAARSGLAAASGRLLPPARDRSLAAAHETILPGGGAVEQVSRGFVQSLRNTRDVLARNFSANTYLPKATRNLASSMNVAARQLTGTKIAGLLPSKEMMEPLRFQRAALKARIIDEANAREARRIDRGVVPLGGFPSEGMMGPSRSVDRSFSNYITAEFTRMMRAGALGGGYAFPNAPMMGPSSQLPPRGSMTVESFGNIRALGGRFPSARMLQVGGPPAMAQHMGGMMSGYQTRAGAMGGYNPGVRSSAFFPMEGMLAPSSPLGRITAQSSMFGGGPPPTPPGGGGGSFGGFGGFGREFNKAMSTTGLPGSGMIREIGSEFAFATKQVLLFGQAYKLLGFAQDFPAQVAQAVGELQSFRNTLKAISPTAQEVSASNEFIMNVVDKYNVPLESARAGFTKLYASMEPAGFKGDEIRNLFLGISKAAATFGMSSDKVDRVMYAFAQMASKGQVMSEELKGQLGDVLPGALGIFAKAAGFEGPQAIEKFSKALEDGAFKGDSMRKLLKNVSFDLNKEFGPGAEGAARTYQGVMNRMQNSTKLFYESFEPLAVAFANDLIVPVSQGLRNIADGIKAYTTGSKPATEEAANFATMLRNMAPTLEGIRNNIGLVGTSLLETGKIIGFVTLQFSQLLGLPIVGQLAAGYASVLLLSGAFKLLGGQALVATIASLIQFSAQSTAAITLTNSLSTSTLAYRLAAIQAAAATTQFGNTLNIVMARTVIGVALVALGALIGKIVEVRSQMAAIGGDAKGMQEAARISAKFGDVPGTKEQLGNIKARANTFKQLKQQIEELGDIKTSGSAFSDRGVINDSLQLSTALGNKLVEMGLVQQSQLTKNNSGYKVLKATLDSVGGLINSNIDAFEKASSKESEYLREAERNRRKLADRQKVDLSGGDEKAAEKRRREQEKLANQQQQLAMDAAGRENALQKAILEGRIAVDDQVFEHYKKLADAKVQYELAGLNSIEARQLKHQDDLRKIELNRVEAVRKASEKSQQATMEFTAAKRTAAAAGGGGGSTGLFQGSTGVSSGPHFDVRRADGGRITEAEARALFSAEVRKQLTMTSGYGPRNTGIPGASTFHRGIDLAGPANTPLSLAPSYSMQGVGLEGGLGYAATVAGPQGQTYKVGHLQKPGASFARQRRTEKAEGKFEVEQQQLLNQTMQAGVAIRQATIEAIENTKAAIAQNISTIFPVAEQKLENDLLELRNKLQIEGMSEEYIRMKEQSYKVDYEGARALDVYTKRLTELQNLLKPLQDKRDKKQLLSPEETEEFDRLTKLIGVYKNAIEVLPSTQRMFNEELTRTYNLAIAAQSPLNQISTAYATTKRNLEELKNWGYQAVEAGKAIGSAFGTAFKDVVSGSASAQEALASMMQSIADHFLDMAAQIIAQQITMMIYGIILKALGIEGGLGSMGGGGGFGSFDASGGFGIGGMDLPGLGGAGALSPAGMYSGIKFANGGIASGGFAPFKAFASGGMVAGPTLGLVGEGKYNEAIVPLPDGRSIPVQLQDSSIRDKMGDSMSSMGGMPMLSMNFQSTTINGVEYVDRAQLEAAMAETRKISVREGATRGATIALDKLANSPSSRRRVGLR